METSEINAELGSISTKTNNIVCIYGEKGIEGPKCALFDCADSEC